MTKYQYTCEFNIVSQKNSMLQFSLYITKICKKQFDFILCKKDKLNFILL